MMGNTVLKELIIIFLFDIMPGVVLIGNRQNSRRGPIETVICPLIITK